jgi:hypothetical protein
MDLIFLVNPAGERWMHFHNVMEPFIKKFAGLFKIGKNATQIGLISVRLFQNFVSIPIPIPGRKILFDSDENLKIP